MISTSKNNATNSNSSHQVKSSPSNLSAYYFYGGSVILAVASAAFLITSCAHAQSPNNVSPAAPAAEEAALAPIRATPIPTPQTDSQPAHQDTAKPAPKYSQKDIERAFNFLDANRDGHISREEASGFRNVAKYFDAADTNKDNMLSLEEFGKALNRP